MFCAISRHYSQIFSEVSKTNRRTQNTFGIGKNSIVVKKKTFVRNLFSDIWLFLKSSHVSGIKMEDFHYCKTHTCGDVSYNNANRIHRSVEEISTNILLIFAIFDFNTSKEKH